MNSESESSALPAAASSIDPPPPPPPPAPPLPVPCEATLSEDLFQAIKEGNLPAFLLLLRFADENGIDVGEMRSRAEKEENATLLHIAVSKGNVEFIEALLAEKMEQKTNVPIPMETNDAPPPPPPLRKRRVNPALADEDGITPLLLAAAKRDVASFSALMKHEDKASLLRAVDNDGCTVLHAAAANGDLPMAELILNHVQEEENGSCFPFISIKSAAGDNALHVAVDQGNVDLFKEILKRCTLREEKAELLNTKDGAGNNILHLAATSGQAMMVHQILERDAAEEGGVANGFVGLLDVVDGKNALHLAAAFDNLNTFKHILKGCTTSEQRRVLLNAENVDGFTPLMIAALKQHRQQQQQQQPPQEYQAIDFAKAILLDISAEEAKIASIQPPPIQAATISSSSQISVQPPAALATIAETTTTSDSSATVSSFFSSSQNEKEQAKNAIASSTSSQNGNEEAITTASVQTSASPAAIIGTTTANSSTIGSSSYSSSQNDKEQTNGSASSGPLAATTASSSSSSSNNEEANSTASVPPIQALGAPAPASSLSSSSSKEQISTPSPQWSEFENFTAFMKETKRNVLHLAAENGHAAFFSLVLEASARRQLDHHLLLSIDGDGWTPLHRAAWSDHLPVVEVILSAMAAQESLLRKPLLFARISKFQKTALHLSVENDQKDDSVMRAILLRGCENKEQRKELILAKDDRGANVLHSLVSFERIQLLESLFSIIEETDGEEYVSLLLSSKNLDNCTALHFAAEIENFDVFLFLIRKLDRYPQLQRELLNSTDETGSTILHVAAWAGRVKIVQWLLSPDGGRARGFDKIFAGVEDRQRTAMHAAVESGHGDVFDALLNGCPNEADKKALLNTADASGWTVLHIAVGNQDVATTRRILSLPPLSPAAAAATTTVENGGEVAAVSGGEIQTGSEEIKQQESTAVATAAAETTIQDVQEQTPPLQPSDVAAPAACGLFDQLFAVTRATRRNALHMAVLEGNTDVIRAILQACKSKKDKTKLLLKSVDSGGLTMLHIAASAGNVYLANLILTMAGENAVALISEPDAQNESPLHIAAGQGHLSVVECLLRFCPSARDKKFVLKMKSERGFTVLHSAACSGESRVIDFLFSRKRNGDYRFANLFQSSALEKGFTPLHAAITYRSVSGIQAILEGIGAGARRRKMLFADFSSCGLNALHLAVGVGHPMSIRVLLSIPEAAMLREATDSLGMTALHRAACGRGPNLGGVDPESCEEWALTFSAHIMQFENVVGDDVDVDDDDDDGGDEGGIDERGGAAGGGLAPLLVPPREEQGGDGMIDRGEEEEGQGGGEAAGEDGIMAIGEVARNFARRFDARVAADVVFALLYPSEGSPIPNRAVEGEGEGEGTRNGEDERMEDVEDNNNNDDESGEKQQQQQQPHNITGGVDVNTIWTRPLPSISSKRKEREGDEKEEEEGKEEE